METPARSATSTSVDFFAVAIAVLCVVGRRFVNVYKNVYRTVSRFAARSRGRR
jgi:hypothetical protein